MKQFNLEEYLKNPSKKIVTRDGRDVRIICTDFNNPDFPVVAEIKGYKWPISFAINGMAINERQLCSDLFFAPEKHEGWINIYFGKDGPISGNIIFNSKEEAEESSRHCIGFTKDLYITSIKIEWED